MTDSVFHVSRFHASRFLVSPYNPKTWIAPAIVLGVCVLLGGCADEPPAPEPAPESQELPEVSQEELDRALSEYCLAEGGCQAGKADGSFALDTWKFLTGSAGIVLSGDRAAATEQFFDDPQQCPNAGQMSHFIDLADRVDGVPLFTSVQDFVIEREDVSPEEVVQVFREDWLPWWDGGTTAPGSVGMLDNGDFGIEIRPLGVSAVSIKMAVHEPQPNPTHPPLENPKRDKHWNGVEKEWDWGVEIDMSRGNAFEGTMYILARKLEDGSGVHVREMWYRTEPVAPLVMKYLPIRLFIGWGEDPVKARLHLSAFLHLAATQGCAVPKGTGYPGLIKRFEAGELPASR